MSRNKSFCYLAATVALSVLVCVTAVAQSSGAILNGTVLDQNGAVVPSVTITVLNRTTGLERRVVTNEDGSFTFPLLPPGEYVMTAQREGFATIKVPDLVVNINDQRSVKLLLKVGGINGTIEIISTASILQQPTGQSTVIDRQFVANLPLNGRGIQSLVGLAPGVVEVGTFNNPEFGLFSVNGQRPGSNYYTIDGVSAGVGLFGLVQGQNGIANPAFSVPGGTNSLVSADSVREIRILTSSYAAEYGRTPGAQVQITTRSGTNKFSGSLFEYLRNDALDATDFFVKSPPLLNFVTSFTKPPLRMNDFGGVIGGPIVKNRTFFFASYEGMRLLQPAFGTAQVPSAGARQSAPASLKPLLNASPVPNGPELGTSGLATFSAAFSNPSSLDSTSIRVDHILNAGLTFFGKYTNSPSQIDQRVFSLSTIHRSEQRVQTLTAGVVWLTNADVTNESTINYSRYRMSGSYVMDDFAGAVPFPDSVVFPSSAPGGNSIFILLAVDPTAERSSFFFRLFHGTQETGLQRQINLVDNLSITHHSHQLKFGADYRYLYPHFIPTQYEQEIQFLGGITETTPGSLFSGIASVASIVSNDPRTVYFTNLSLYAQDTWKANGRLTLTYGLRWELNPAPKLSIGRGLPTLQTVNGTPQVVLPDDVQPVYKTSYNNFAPRFGLSVQLFQATGRELVLRAGAGTFYDLGYTGGDLTPSFPATRVRQFRDVQFPLNPALSGPVATPPDSNFGFPFALVGFDSNFKLPRTYEWNVSLEQSIGRNQIISAAYVGAAGRRLVHQQQVALQVTLPSPTTVLQQSFDNNSSSDYNSFQLRFQRRLSRGFQFLGSYTLAHSTDTDSLIDGSGIPDSSHGSSNFDVRHSFSLAISYDLPKSESGIRANPLFKDWSADLISRGRSALPLDVFENNALLLAEGQASIRRPDLNPGVPLYLKDQSVPGGRRINPSAFSLVTTDRQGTLGRNVLRGFPSWQIDFGIHRQFKITDQAKLQIRVETFNLFNHANFANPSGDLMFPPTFGIVQSSLASSNIAGSPIGGFGALNQIGGPRSVQFALRLQF